jgi:hypothetical protein
VKNRIAVHLQLVTQCRPHAGKKLVRPERLGDVIVSAQRGRPFEPGQSGKVARRHLRACLMLKAQGQPNRERSSPSPPHLGMSLKPWASPHGTLLGSNATNAGRYHAASGAVQELIEISSTMPSPSQLDAHRENFDAHACPPLFASHASMRRILQPVASPAFHAPIPPMPPPGPPGIVQDETPHRAADVSRISSLTSRKNVAARRVREQPLEGRRKNFRSVAVASLERGRIRCKQQRVARVH